MDSIRRYIGPNRWSRRYRLRMVWRAAGDIVALSPASASFDLYPNFEKRGEHFKKLVAALKP